MKEWDKPLIIAMRLKVINGKITEIEHVLARNIRSYGPHAESDHRAAGAAGRR
jgi:hypothetical protein